MSKWKPEIAQEYWYISAIRGITESREDVINTVHLGTAKDYLFINTGNCFRTKAEAQSAKTKIKSILKGEME